ncbi:fumarylacetoacetate hydrolase family protein [Streptomyces formicae]|uniref:Fumarylacetoacetate hydrolase family protein n=1 Tax=Streptomyces formicae TaxID=1616117 RepID=A0ABY3WK70_9ACTN|nr:fumarylacetoacetate hydrolase family protein [Streptomyces formicae]UNM13007.1 fumarylacetoacetate hydrolase family protein [Streptomyces formicae]
MKLATLRTADGTAAVRVDGTRAVETGLPDVGALLALPGWKDVAAAASGPEHALDEADFAPVVPRPGKIICVGLNYRRHILEMGRDLPEHPTLFAKFASSLIGAADDIVLPWASDAMDWEGELAVVIGSPARHIRPEDAARHIAGYAVLNDVTARDWQFRTREWLQGKTFEATTPLGPVLVTEDDPGLDRGSMELLCEVDGQVVQRADTADLVFGPETLVSYISTVLTLEPGDVIATGTPGGVGHARTPQRYLTDGSVVTTRISGIGELRNVCRAEKLG